MGKSDEQLARLKRLYRYPQTYHARPTEDYQTAHEVLVDSQHTITWAPAFVLPVINTPPEFDPQIYWSNQIWHAISKALFAKDILMQIKLKWDNLKYPSSKITRSADFFRLPVLNTPSSLW